MHRGDVGWLFAVTALAGFGLLLKVVPRERFVFPDRGAANERIAVRLVDAGFSLDPPRFTGDWGRVAHRGSCSLMAGVAGDMGQDLALWERAAKDGGRLRYQYRGTSRPDFPRFRAPLEDQLQRQLARLGIWTHRPPVVATIERGNCNGLMPQLDNDPVSLKWVQWG